MRKHCLHIQKTQSSVSIQNVEYLKVNTYFGDMAGTSEHAVCKSCDSDDKSNSDEVKSRMEERWLFLLFIVAEGLLISYRGTIKAKEREKTVTGVIK